MLVIRQEQMEVLRREPRLRFEREMAAYLKRYFPFESAHADLQEWVRTGLDRAARSGFLSREEAAQYLALMAMLGAGFEEDPQIPWAGEILSDQDQPSDERISRLYDRAIDYLDSIGGPKGSWYRRAKLRVSAQDMTVLNRGVHPRALAFRIRDVLTGLYPQKAELAGRKALEGLAELAIARSGHSQAALIHAVHMYYLGSEFHRDPCYPWAAAALADNSAASPEERHLRMHHRFLEYLEQSD